MGSFKPDNLRLIYHLLESQKLYNKEFLEHFAKENEDSMDVTQTWKLGGGKLKWDKTGMYSITSLSAPHSFTTIMMCRLFGNLNNSKFSMEWLLLIDATVNATIVNWSKILSDNLAKAIMEYRKKRNVFQGFPPFLYEWFCYGCNLFLFSVSKYGVEVDCTEPAPHPYIP